MLLKIKQLLFWFSITNLLFFDKLSANTEKHDGGVIKKSYNSNSKEEKKIASFCVESIDEVKDATEWTEFVRYSLIFAFCDKKEKQAQQTSEPETIENDEIISKANQNQMVWNISEEFDHLETLQKEIMAVGQLPIKMFLYESSSFQELQKCWDQSNQMDLLFSLQKNPFKIIQNPNNRQTTRPPTFLWTADNLFFLKSITAVSPKGNAMPKSEIQFFRNHLKEYFKYMRENPKSTIARFYALISLRSINASANLPNPKEENYFFITNNILPAGLDYRFDLKGSASRQKKANNKGAVTNQANSSALDMVDELDGIFKKGILLSNANYIEFMKKLEMDTEFLAKRKLFDYSLLLGIKFFDSEEDAKKFIKHSQKERTFINPNVLRAKCFDCRRGPNEDFANHSHLLIFPGIIDILEQWNFRKVVRMMNRVAFSKSEKPPKKADLSCGPNPSIYRKRFLCSMATKIFQPEQKNELTKNIFSEDYCNWRKEVDEPNKEKLLKEMKSKYTMGPVSHDDK